MAVRPEDMGRLKSPEPNNTASDVPDKNESLETTQPDTFMDIDKENEGQDASATHMTQTIPQAAEAASTGLKVAMKNKLDFDFNVEDDKDDQRKAVR